jgi:hypothetical protein
MMKDISEPVLLYRSWQTFRMRYKLSIFLALIVLISCKNQTQERTESDNVEVISEQEVVSQKSITESTRIKSEELSDCDKYWMNRFPNDSIKSKYIDGIISKSQLTANNLEFLKALKDQKQDKLAFENVLSPILYKSNSRLSAILKHKTINQWSLLSDSLVG